MKRSVQVLQRAGILVDELAVFVLGDDLLAGRTAHEHIAQVDGLELAGGDQGADVAGAQANDRLEVDRRAARAAAASRW